MRVKLRWAVLLLLVVSARAWAQTPVVYSVSFPAPEHRWAQVQVTFSALPAGPLHAVMSRASPGRYALHEFAKNVFDVHATDGAGHPLAATRPDPYGWDVAGHDGTVRLTYKVYGDTIDGTYLAVDVTHAHMNLPAILMWAKGLEDRPVRITFSAPAGSHWKPATQLYPTSDPWTFTAPNLQYLFDSPTELSAYALREFTVRNPDGRTFTVRTAVHAEATDAQVDAYAAGVQKIVEQAMQVFGEFPAYEPGTYTFLADYLPWANGDGMEHRNSTVVTGRSLATALNTASHEFFHCWNVERIRPQGLEPFDFERANMTDSLWLAEGFTQYYGPLIMTRAGLTDPRQTISGFGRLANAVVNGTGRQFNSVVGMSHMAPFVDAARAVDRTDFRNTFISYYTYGAAVALALDLSLRGRSGGRVTLDDFMRAMWRTYGKPGGPQPGLVAHPYALTDIRDRIADVSGDRAFADDFFQRFIVGREAADYTTLLAKAGIVLRKRNAGQAWMGAVQLDGQKVNALVPWGSPAYDAGLEQDDVVTSVDGTPVSGTSELQEVLRRHAPGDRLPIAFTRRGIAVHGEVTLEADPSLEAVPIESTGGTLTPEQQAFRNAWLGAPAAGGQGIKP
ncbi:MAG TPA: PDZ domain-containing protein [Vicinamibacterales bacterium]|nr:PDZ domain-containing protein [Vicinamibacterales bacterium]